MTNTTDAISQTIADELAYIKEHINLDDAAQQQLTSAIRGIATVLDGARVGIPLLANLCPELAVAAPITGLVSQALNGLVDALESRPEE